MAGSLFLNYYAQAVRDLNLLCRTLLLSRSMRALSYYGKHKSLFRLSTYRDYAISKLDAVQFHHLGRQGYLHSSFGMRERVESIICHYRFEEEHFNAAYKTAVYAAKGLQLWTHTTGKDSFIIRLRRELSSDVEGELTISLIANSVVLHQLSFTWIGGHIFEIPENSIPFITRNQRQSTDSAEALSAFEKCFGSSVPDFFCIAAIQGIAQSLGVNNLLAINYNSQVKFTPTEVEQFQRAYDGFWKVLGAVRLRSGVWFLRLPFYTKPMSEIPSKNRKRTAIRRRQWSAVGESAHVIIRNHFLSDSPNNKRDRSANEVAEL